MKTNLLRWVPWKKREAVLSVVPEGAAPTAATLPATAPIAENPGRIVYVDEQYVWIENDGLLRDEGVLFGISGADTTDKIAAIRNYYNGLKAAPEAGKEALQPQITRATQALQEVAAKLQEPASTEADAAEASASRTNYFRNVLGLVVLLVAAYGSFYLVRYYVAPVYGLAAALGIFFFGLFAQMAPVSSWILPEAGEAREGVRHWLLDAAPSASAAVVTAYFVFEATGAPLKAALLGFFLLILFFYNGKLILGLSQVLAQEWRRSRTLREERFQRADALAAATREQERVLAEQERLQQLLDQLKEQERQAQQRIDELEQAALGKVALFLSEYRLARHFATQSKSSSHE
ncbi:MAG: hypothetical protein EOO06_03335 [Chitinophagaceae bacterium]|nr:MAG: hypothetical protein EOO06_03335 [Chitinophagaceae bacterium]